MRHLRWSGQRRAGIAAGALGLLAALFPAGSAAAEPARWALVSADVSPGVTPGYNINDKRVAVLGASDGKVRIAIGRSIVEDLGRPPGAPVGKLALTEDQVYALARDGSVTHFNRAAGRWETLAVGMIDLMASRAGASVIEDNQPPRFIPDLYVVAAAGGVWRLRGDPQRGGGWELIGMDSDVDALVERGYGYTTPTTLFEHTTGGAVRQWSGTGTTWLTIGSSFSFISADEINLIATDAAGKAQLYNDRPGSWGMLPRPAAAVLPYAPGGRAIAADNKTYYLTSTGDIFAIRYVHWGSVSIAGWAHLAAGPVVALSPHFPADYGTDDGTVAAAVRADGTLTELNWPTIQVASAFSPAPVYPPDPVFPPDAETGGIYQYTDTHAVDWSGRLRVLVETGSLPPGITAGTTSQGELMLSGRPTVTGVFVATLLLYDDTGAVFSVYVTLRVVDGPGPVFTSKHWVNPTSSLTLVNCLPDRAFMAVWTREFPSDGSYPDWENHGLAASRSGLPGCTATSSAAITYTPPPDHTVEVVGLDTGAPNCAGRNDPDVAGCVLFHRQITGAAGLAPEVVTLIG
ncbi:hypothetical protein [Actinoplanes subtropicus]|uniref:hypothetical protein n=1 Tax=Actinoplanes subtropicus TaxID=543632 RepID=UPI0004C2CE79|nr:hypothetical protein [Actinoplanes subtropicus]